jgi:endonuclease YncB( thermonuclease family)
MRAGVSMIRRRIFLFLVMAWTVTLANSAAQAACDSPVLGTGHIAAILDARTLRLGDGREVRLSGIEIPKSAEAASIVWLHDHALKQTVTLRGNDDAPDRYGRQHAFVVLGSDDASLQSALVRNGHAVASVTTGGKGCAGELKAAELHAEDARLGIWSQPGLVLDAAKTSEILKYIGCFAVVEGTILSARQAGATLYLNFARRRIQGFAVTVSRRMMTGFAAAGMTPAALTGQRVRVRGWISQHGGPRMEARLPSQVELVNDTRTAAAGGK